MTEQVIITVEGLTGSGKSRITYEIMVALKAVGIRVFWQSLDDKRAAEAESQSEATGGWQPPLPHVLIIEKNISRGHS